ncbi:MAG: hypothetical protein PW789_08990 [Edaphobacter sp.]|uniref:hypothetical protein n=1 Tax=Edaphobacter sp. TaxID=1934404 RepID=UPI00238D3BE5|nr:hypothetical protein [Edaphobacter sp.]MDE1176732.1 hypothetical protein [Edaphobacter sp.]
MSAAPIILPIVWATASSSRPAPKKKTSAPTPVLPELAFYRKYTEALLRRYTRLSMESGRAPSLLGREMFRGNVTHYKVEGFDDVVIFVHDVEQCLKLLSPDEVYVLRRIAIQEYTQAETAAMLRLPIRTLVRRYDRALDALTRIFLDRRLLKPLAGCQDVEIKK